MNVVDRWMGPVTLAALILTSCGAQSEPGDGDAEQNRAGAGGDDGTGAAGQGAMANSGSAGNGTSGSGGSPNGCESDSESGCDVDAGASLPSGGTGGSDGGTSGAGGLGNADAGGGEEPASVYYLTTVSLFEDATYYTTGAMPVADPAPDRSLFVVVQTASNGVTSAQRVLVNGVEATKLVAVGEDVQPSAPSALFAIPFPSDLQASVEVEMSSTVTRCAVSLLAAYGLHNTGVDDSQTLVAKTSGSMTIDVAAGGTVITALAMATNSTNPTAEQIGFDGTGYFEVLPEGTRTLIFVGASSSSSAGPQVVSFAASDPMFNFRAFAAAIH